MGMVPQEGTCFKSTGKSSKMSIEPQYDGVIMLSPETVLFSDAKPRPDGRKIYHVFEKSTEASEETTMSEDFCTKREALFSHAHENSLHNVQQVLRENGALGQEWCCISHSNGNKMMNLKTSLLNCPIYSQSTISSHQPHTGSSSENKSRVCSTHVQQSTTPISVYQQPICSSQIIPTTLTYQVPNIQSPHLIRSVEQLSLNDVLDETTLTILEDVPSNLIKSVETDDKGLLNDSLPSENTYINILDTNDKLILNSELYPQSPVYESLYNIGQMNLPLSTYLTLSAVQPEFIVSSSLSNSTEPILLPQQVQVATVQQPVLHQVSSIQYHLFEMCFSLGPQKKSEERRLQKRLRRRGAVQIDLEPENKRIGVKTTQSHRSVLTLLRKVDPTARHIVTTQEIMISEEITDLCDSFSNL